MSPTAVSTGRVLLVDDDPLVCGSLRRILEVDGMKVQVAANAQEALAVCEKEKFDLIILDYLMPAMRGDQLAVAIKERFPNRPIIMITADAEKVNSLKKTPDGVDLIMAKPFGLDDFRQAVNKVLPKQSATK